MPATLAVPLAPSTWMIVAWTGRAATRVRAKGRILRSRTPGVRSGPKSDRPLERLGVEDRGLYDLLGDLGCEV